MEFYERVSGARLHAAYVRPGGVSQVRCFKGYFCVMSLALSATFVVIDLCMEFETLFS